jgi:hypothetical protein
VDVDLNQPKIKLVIDLKPLMALWMENVDYIAPMDVRFLALFINK